MMDYRTKLPEKYVLIGSNTQYTIMEEIGRGANCIVYNASYIDSVGLTHLARIKELYPIYLPINRDYNYQISCAESNTDKFEDARRRFKGAYEKNVSFKNTYGVMNSTANAADLFSTNGTDYIVTNLDEGKDYRQYQDDNLLETLMHVKALASVISKYHEDGYLHLDIKPENVFVIPETAEHVYLFDFDSVCKISDLNSAKVVDLSYSEGFTAPEQVQGKISKIGVKTDIYSIGALLFFKLFGRKPTFEEGRYSAHYDYKEMKFYDERLRPAFFRCLDEFLHKTLATSTALRWNTVEQVICAIDKLIEYSDVESAFLIDTFTYNSANFVGRVNEIETIYEEIQENNVLFLSGIGGIGKTELAKKFIAEYREEFDTVAFAYYQESIEHTMCQELLINNMELDEDESESEYFDRIIDVLRRTASDKDLILLDNFDVERDDRLEELLQCPCKFLITTRNRNVRDWNFNEVKIDRMDDEDDLWSLFETYNDDEYEESERTYISKLIDFVDGHTMTVELISKYLRDTGMQPILLYQSFLEKSGITNTDDSLCVNHRKDRKMNSESVNRHLSILFDVFGFDKVSKEIMSSLSLFSGMRINRERFETICKTENISAYIDKLVGRGWVELNEDTGKISLHQIVLDLIYTKLNPTTESCSHIAEGMCQYVKEKVENYSERKIRRKVFKVFAERITGENILYSKICLEQGDEDKIGKAIQICRQYSTEEAYALLVDLYMEKVRILCRCNDMFEAECSLEEYCENQAKLIDPEIENAIEACKKLNCYNQDKQIYELVDLAKRIDGQIGELMLNGCFDETESIDSIYKKVINLIGLVNEDILISSLSYEEKEKTLEFARDFYSDGDYCAMYRWEHYSDFEKVYYYQRILDELREEKEGSDSVIYIHAGDKSLSEVGDGFMEQGKYVSAIEMYKKACDEDEEPLDWILPRLSEAYYKMGDIDSAIACLVEVLDYDKCRIESEDARGRYSGYICLELVKILFEEGRGDDAKEYAKELISYLEPEISENVEDYGTISDVLIAYWYLYSLEDNQASKKSYWKKCDRLFHQLNGEQLDEQLRDFIVLYLCQNEINYDEMLQIVYCFDPGYGNNEKTISLIDEILNYHRDKEGFMQYRIELLNKCAELAGDYSYKGPNDSLDYCIEAEGLLKEIAEDKKEFLKNKIIMTKAEIMSNKSECDYDEVNDVRKQCNYYLVAEIESQNLGNEEKIEIWKNAASNYYYVNDYNNQIRCLIQAYEIMVPILNEFEYCRFDYNLWYILNDLARAWMNLANKTQAASIIREMYERAIDYYSNKKDDKHEYLYKIKEVAGLYENNGDKEKAYRGYLVWLYIALSDTPNAGVLSNFFCNKKDMELVIKELLENITESEIDNVDILIDYKDSVEGLNMSKEEMQLVQPLLDVIINKYQNKDIEFK